VIYKGETGLKDHSKKCNSVHTFNTIKSLGETVFARMRTICYKFFGFMEINYYQTIRFSPESNVRNLVREGVSVFSGLTN